MEWLTDHLVGWAQLQCPKAHQKQPNSNFFHKHRWAFGESGMMEILYGRLSVRANMLQPSPPPPTRRLATSSSRQTSPDTGPGPRRAAVVAAGGSRILLHHRFRRALLPRPAFKCSTLRISKTCQTSEIRCSKQHWMVCSNKGLGLVMNVGNGREHSSDANRNVAAHGVARALGCYGEDNKRGAREILEEGKDTTLQPDRFARVRWRRCWPCTTYRFRCASLLFF
jgi:hypothetical protein